MSEQSINLAILLERFDGMKALINQRFDSQDKVILDIHEKASKTNGRVKALEKYQWGIIGAVGIITVLVLPILFMIVSKFINGSNF